MCNYRKLEGTCKNAHGAHNASKFLKYPDIIVIFPIVLVKILIYINVHSLFIAKYVFVINIIKYSTENRILNTQYNIHTISCCVHWNVNLHEHPQPVYYKSAISFAYTLRKMCKGKCNKVDKEKFVEIYHEMQRTGRCPNITGSECSSNKHLQIACEFFNQILIRFSSCPFDRTANTGQYEVTRIDTGILSG